MAVKANSKLSLSLLGISTGCLVFIWCPSRLTLVLFLSLSIGGYLSPRLVTSRRRRQQIESLEVEFPALLELMATGFESGLQLRGVLTALSQLQQGPFTKELKLLVTEMDLGLTQQQALVRWAERCDFAGMQQLVAGLARSLKHGHSPSELLRAQARQARSVQIKRITERAQRATPKVQLVMAVLLVPAVLLLVAAYLIALF